MSERTMDGFFDRLELELRAAAERGPRRMRRPSPALAFALAAVAVAAVVALAVLGDGEPRVADNAAGPPPVGTVVHRSDGDHTVVATGTTPVAGPWQMETYLSERLADPKTDEEYQPAGLPCLGVFLAGPSGMAPWGGGQCGDFPRTPGFSRVELPVPVHAAEAGEILVYGRAPEDATKVVLIEEGGLRKEFTPLEGPPGEEGDFYLFAIPPGVKGRVNWLDQQGNEGSRGIELLPY